MPEPIKTKVVNGKLTCLLCNREIKSANELQQLIKKFMVEECYNKSVPQSQWSKIVDDKIIQKGVCTHIGFKELHVVDKKTKKVESVINQGPDEKINFDDVIFKNDERDEKDYSRFFKDLKQLYDKGVTKEDLIKVLYIEMPGFNEKMEKIFRDFLEKGENK